MNLDVAIEVASGFVRSGQIPCAVFGVTDSSGRMATHAVAGDGPTVDADTIFFLASVSKAIVATAVMSYVDDGRLDLDAPLVRYLPEFDQDGQASITAAHVLTHTSGLPDMPIEMLRDKRPSYRRSLEFALAGIPAWAPGSRYEYNSNAWLLLAEVMARLSHLPFDEALRVRLTGPLAMADTGFDPRYARKRIAKVHGLRIQNRLVQEILLRFLVRAQLPGGGLFGSVHDLLRLGRALLPAGVDDAAPRILSPAAIREMAQLRTDGMTYVQEDGSVHDVRQAMGWRKPRAGWPGSGAAFTHAGICGGRVWIDPEADLAFAFLTNLWQAPEEPGLAVLEEVYRARA